MRKTQTQTETETEGIFYHIYVLLTSLHKRFPVDVALLSNDLFV